MSWGRQLEGEVAQNHPGFVTQWFGETGEQCLAVLGGV